MGVKITIYAEVHPTEDIEKIKKAILSLFPDCRFEVSENSLIGRAESIEEFARVLREQRIRDAARGVLLKNLKEDRLEFWISKQVATKGKVSFSVGNVPLGDLRIVIEGENLRTLVDEIAPDTSQKQSRS